MTVLYLGNKNYSSWSIRALLVARASGILIEERVLPLGPEETYDILLKETDQHRVPVLVTDGTVIHDSLAIVEWLAEKAAPGKVWPVDEVKRAKARSLCAEMHASFIDLRSDMGVDIRSSHPTPAMTSGLKWDISRILEIWTRARAEYEQDGPYLFGEWSAADAFYMPVATRFRTYGVELEGIHEAYAQAVLAHPLSAQLIEEAKAEPWSVDLSKFRPKSAD